MGDARGASCDCKYRLPHQFVYFALYTILMKCRVRGCKEKADHIHARDWREGNPLYKNTKTPP